MATIFTSGQFQAIGNDGKVVPYGKLYFYEAGTLTPVNSYTTALKDATNTIPVVISASGKADVFLDEGVIDIVLKDSLDVVVWTIENFKTSNTFDNTGTGLVSTNNQDAIVEVLKTHYPIDTIADLKLMTITPLTVYVSGYYTKNDGAFGSHFFRLATDTGQVDNGGTIIRTINGVYELQYSGAANVKFFGIKYDLVIDQTAIMQGIIDEMDCYIENITFAVSKIDVPSNRSIYTGNNVTIKQLSGILTDTRVINIVGSNVQIGDMTIEGNIATDTGEQKHGIFIQANATVGSLSNITIGNITGKNIRGDVIYIGQANTGQKVSNVLIGNLIGDNILRNIISIVSGNFITIGDISGSAVGFCHIDIEPNVGSGVAKNIRVGNVIGRLIGINSPTAVDYIDNVIFSNLDLSPTFTTQSTPSYAAGVAIEDAISLRNTKNLKLGNVKIDGYNRCAIFTYFNSGEIGCESLVIDNLDINDCSKTDATYLSYLQFGATTFNIGSLTAVHTTTGTHRVFANVDKGGKVGIAKITLGSGNNLTNSSNNIVINRLDHTGGIVFQSSSNIKVLSSLIDCERLGSYSTKLSFENSTVVASTFLFNSGFENHSIVNSTLNTIYYGVGRTHYTYLNTITLGVFNMWVSSTGKLYIKSGIPTSDTDGTVVGTQA
jgi:hypothetical protein